MTTSHENAAQAKTSPGKAHDQSRPADDPHVIFLHIPKTAGMSLHGLFVRNYRGRGIYNMEVKDITQKQWNDGLERVRNIPPEKLASYKVFKGHMIFGLHDLLPGPSEYITFLRDPVKRVVSHYKMVHDLGAFPEDHVLDPAKEFWGMETYPAFHRSLDNYQVRAISGLDFELPFGAVNVEHLARAKANLDRHFKFVGITDRFDLSLLLMRRICGWKWRHYISDNIGSKSATKIAPEIIAQLQDLNRYDRELYQYGHERFNRLVEQYGPRLLVEQKAFQIGNKAHLLLHRGRHKIKRALGSKGGRDFSADYQVARTGRTRISLITPTYQQAATIRETIESVLGQSHRELEYWVIDGGSSDGTVDILRSYEKDPRFHWISERDDGQSDAINKGLARCTGELFNWINSDDYLEAGALARVAEAFQQNPGADIFSGLTAEFRGNPPQEFNRIRLQVRATAEATIPVGVYCQPSTFWRMEIIRALGGVDAALHYVMDWDLWVRYLARYGQDKVVRLDDLLAHYRHHDAAKTSKASDQFYDEARTVFQDLHLSLDAPEEFLLPEAERGSRPPRKIEVGSAFDRERYLGCYAERMVRTYRDKDPALAKSWLGRTWAHKPWITPWRLKMALRLAVR